MGGSISGGMPMDGNDPARRLYGLGVDPAGAETLGADLDPLPVAAFHHVNDLQVGKLPFLADIVGMTDAVAVKWLLPANLTFPRH
jgi:hypothetical protein